MGRQPCCDKVGLKKGPWTADEDKKLINFILTNGQCCWRAVPKLAGFSLSFTLPSKYYMSESRLLHTCRAYYMLTFESILQILELARIYCNWVFFGHYRTAEVW